MSTSILENDSHSPPVHGARGKTTACEFEVSIDWVWAIFAAGVVVLFCLGILVVEPQWFWQDDFQSYQLANFRDVARSWYSGEFPLLTPYSWECGALAGEYQNGVFSLFLSGLAYLIFAFDGPLEQAAAAFSITHLAILAAGTYRLGRVRGLRNETALFMAWNTALSGWILVWGAKAWFPALASFAWLPWFWWGLERGLCSDANAPKPSVTGLLLSRFLPAGIFLYLILTAGWPFTVLMAALVTTWMVLKHRATQGNLWQAWPTVVAWSVGMGLSAPAWLMLIEYAHETVRGQTHTWQFTDHWIVPAAALWGFLLPGLRVTWNVFGLDKPHTCLEMAGGLLPLTAILAVFVHTRGRFIRDHAWDLGLAATVLLLAMLPSAGNFRWSFRWLPLLILVISYLGARALEALKTRGNVSSISLGTLAALLVGVVCVPVLVLDPSGSSETLIQGSALGAICLLWGWIATLSRRRGQDFHAWLPAVVSLPLSAIVYFVPTPAWEFPEWDRQTVQAAVPLDSNRRYLSVHEWPDVFDTNWQRTSRPIAASGKGFLPGNFNQYDQIEFINGYSPMQPMGLHELFRIGPHGYLGVASARGNDDYLRPSLELLKSEGGPEDLLALMGVDGLLVADRHKDLIPSFLGQGWYAHAHLVGSTVLHRNSATRRAAFVVTSAWISSDWNAVAQQMRSRKTRDGAWAVYAPARIGGLSESPIGGVIPVHTIHPLVEERIIPAEVASTTSAASQFAQAEIGNVTYNRHRVQVDVKSQAATKPAIIVFSRPWFPGYRATLNGKVLPVIRFGLILPAVLLPAGESGTLILRYLPNSVLLGLELVTLTVVAIAAAGVWNKWARSGGGSCLQKGNARC